MLNGLQFKNDCDNKKRLTVFSIIIPVYNCEKYIADCLNSCLAQNIPPIEYEIICVDDGSTDMSAQILEEYRAKHKNISVLHQSNQGVSVARNKGIEIAKGEYIWFVDADDLIQENILLQLKNKVIEYDSDLFSFTGYVFYGFLTQDQIEAKRCHELCFNEKLTKEYIPIKLFKREIIDNCHLKFVEGITHGEDGLFLFDFQKHMCSNMEFENPIYYYRVHLDSAMHQRDPNELNQKRCIALAKIVLYLFEKYKNESIDKRKLTMDYLFNRRNYLLVVSALLPVSLAITVLKKVKSMGVMDIEKNMSLSKEQLKEVRIHPYRTYFKRRPREWYKNVFSYFVKEKIIDRVRHPIRTLKHIKERIFGKNGKL